MGWAERVETTLVVAFLLALSSSMLGCLFFSSRRSPEPLVSASSAPGYGVEVSFCGTCDCLRGVFGFSRFGSYLTPYASLRYAILPMQPAPGSGRLSLLGACARWSEVTGHHRLAFIAVHYRYLLTDITPIHTTSRSSTTPSFTPSI